MIGHPAVYALNKIWDVDTLRWVPMTQPIVAGGAVGVYSSSFDVSAAAPDLNQLTTASGQVSGSGNNTLLTPTSGKKLRVSYLSYNPASAIECAFRFGAAGALFLRNAVPAGGIIAKDFGDMRYIEGAVNEALILNLSAAVTTTWNCLYIEV